MVRVKSYPRFACPTESVLTEFLADRLASAEVAALEAHLADCAACEKRLDSLSATPEEAFLRPAPTDPALDPPPAVLSRLIAATAASAPADNHLPDPIPGYELISELGRGGMGVVYLARQLGPNRQVALKMLHAGAFATIEDRARFRLEAETAAALAHPGFVPVYEVGEHRGVPYFSMEHISGGSLEKRMKGIPWPADDAATLIGVVARSVDHAHARGVVHRDLKPANILLQEGRGEGQGACTMNALASSLAPVPKISDFGLAVRGEPSQLTRTGVILGTPAYMAPEQVSQAAGVVGPATDIHALGTILYELLTGRPPFAAPDPVETLVQVRFHEPVSPRRVRPDLPRDLDTIVLKCLRKDPNQRYATAADLADDLDRYREGRPVKARPMPAIVRVAKAARRHPGIAALSFLCILVTAIGFVLVFSQWRRAEGEAVAAQAARTREEAARREAVRLSAAAVLDLGISLCERGDDRQGLNELNRAVILAQDAGDGDLLQTAERNLVAWSREYFAPGPPMNHPGQLTAALFTPDGKTVLTAGKDGTINAHDAKSGTARPGFPIQFNRPVRAAAVSPDGRAVLVSISSGDGEPHTLRLLSLADGQPLAKPIRMPWSVRRLVIRADGQAFLAVGEKGVIDGTFEPFQLSKRTLEAGGSIRGAAFASGGRIGIASSSSACLYDPGTDPPSRIELPHGGPITAMVASANGRWIATAGSSIIRIWNAATGEPLGQPMLHPGPVQTLAFGPGNRLAVCAETALRSADTKREPRRDMPAEIWVWDVASGRPAVAPLALPRRAGVLAFSPDGQLLLAGGDDRAIRLFHLTLGVLIGRPLSCPGPVAWATFHPDGGCFLFAGRVPRDGLGTVRESAVELRMTPRTAVDEVRRFSSDGLVDRLAFTADGTALLAGDWTHPPKCWEMTTGRIVAAPSAILPPRMPWADAPLPPRPAECRIWDQARGQRLFPGPSSEPGPRVIYGPDGRSAVGIDGPRAWVWLAGQSPRLLAARPFDYVSAAIRPDGTAALLVGIDRMAELIDLASGEVMLRWEFPEAVWSVAFDPAGRKLVVAGPGVSARLWDANGGGPIGTPLSHTEAGVTQGAFLPDGHTVATSGRDGTVRHWDATSGRSLGPPLRYADRVTAIAFSPDGRRLAAAVEDRRVVVRVMPPP